MCIKQDDEDDWRKEAALMSLVYGGSYINIAASSAKDVHQGCFLKPPYFRDTFRAQVNEHGVQTVKKFWNPDFYNKSFSESHLATRGWALQEKILPSRTLHFRDRGIIWECRAAIASEYHLTHYDTAEFPVQPLVYDTSSVT